MKDTSALFQLLLSLAVIAGCGNGKPDFDSQTAFGYLVKQCEFGPRNPGSTGHKKALEYLAGELEATSDSLKLQEFIHIDESSGRVYNLTNIIASFDPLNPKRVLLGAHWDTRPRSDYDADPAKRSQPLIGANDGASGVAVLLELARILQQNPPPVGVDIILFDGEDFGEEGDLDRYFLGSRHFAMNFEGSKPEWAVIIDMVGDANLELPIERYSYEHNKELVDRVWSAAERAGATQFKRKLGSYVQDDHLMLYEHAGIPAIDIIDMEYVQGGINLWHTSLDTPERCSPESLGAVGKTLIELIYR